MSFPIGKSYLDKNKQHTQIQRENNKMKKNTLDENVELYMY